LTRAAADSFAEDDLGAVMFVPLIGQQGWAEEPASRANARSFFRPRSAVPELIGRAAEPFDDLDGLVFGNLFDRFAGARVVLLGEASHGTNYRARAAITRQLVERHGFTIGEADWPDAARFDCGWNAQQSWTFVRWRMPGRPAQTWVRAERSHDDADVAKSVAVGRGQSPVLSGVGRQLMEGHLEQRWAPVELASLLLLFVLYEIRSKLLSRDRR
jgi:hypothetical protein